MADTLTIGGVAMPEPALNGITISKEKVWSSNTGRSATGEMIGDLIAIKTKLAVKWGVLSQNEVATIDKAVSAAYFDVKYIDPHTNGITTKKFYAGSPTYPIYSYINGKLTYVGVAVDLIEK